MQAAMEREMLPVILMGLQVLVEDPLLVMAMEHRVALKEETMMMVGLEVVHPK